MAIAPRPELVSGHNPLRDLLGAVPRLLGGGAAELRLVVSDRHRDGDGRVHAGVLAVLLDLALGHALLDAAPEVSRPITVTLHMAVRERPRRGVLYARGRVQVTDRGLWWPRAEVRTGGGRLVAQGDGQFLGRPRAGANDWQPQEPSGTVQAKDEATAGR